MIVEDILAEGPKLSVPVQLCASYRPERREFTTTSFGKKNGEMTGLETV